MSKKKRENVESEGISIKDDILTLDEDALSKMFKKKEDIPPAEPGMVQRVIKEEPDIPEEIPEEAPEEKKDPYSLTEKEKEEYRDNMKKEINAVFSKRDIPVLLGSEGDIEMRRLPCVIGKQGDFRITDDTYISRRHCRITEEHGSFYIEDLRSMNGTMVDGIEIREKTLLTEGCSVTLADRSYVFTVRRG